MNKTYKTLLLLILTLLSCGYIGIVKSSAATAEEQLKKIKEQKEKVLAQISQNRFTINGVIVNENNEPLNNVQVKVTSSTNLGLLGSSQKNYIKVVNSKFELTAADCNVVYLDFCKSGYYPAHKSYSVQELLKKNKDQNRNFSVKDVKVTMNSIGESAKTIKKRFILTIFNDGAKQLYSVSDLSKYKISADQPQNNISLNSFYIEEAKDSKGKRKTVEYRGITVPAQILLHLKSNKKDGLILQNEIKDGRLMKEAPESGYTQKPIVLSCQKDIADSKIFFYYRANGIYGKGCIIDIAASRDGLIKVMIAIVQNTENGTKKRILSGDF